MWGKGNSPQHSLDLDLLFFPCTKLLDLYTGANCKLQKQENIKKLFTHHLQFAGLLIFSSPPVSHILFQPFALHFKGTAFQTQLILLRF